MTLHSSAATVESRTLPDVGVRPTDAPTATLGASNDVPSVSPQAPLSGNRAGDTMDSEIAALINSAKRESP